jgi:DNA-binding response OmpR family regulator
VVVYPTKSRGNRRWKILLADDDHDARLIFGSLFEFEGFDVLHAWDGPTALKVIREGEPDLVLLNLFLPHMSGHQVLQTIRADGATATLPCLLMTGDARLEQMGMALINGADGYVTKPAEPTAVLRLVKHLLQEPRTP